MGVWKAKEKTKDGRCWYYDVKIEGKRYKSKKYATKKEAQEAERALYDEQNKTGDQTKMTLKDLFEDGAEKKGFFGPGRRWKKNRRFSQSAFL